MAIPPERERFISDPALYQETLTRELLGAIGEIDLDRKTRSQAEVIAHGGMGYVEVGVAVVQALSDRKLLSPSSMILLDPIAPIDQTGWIDIRTETHQDLSWKPPYTTTARVDEYYVKLPQLGIPDTGDQVSLESAYASRGRDYTRWDFGRRMLNRQPFTPGTREYFERHIRRAEEGRTRYMTLGEKSPSKQSNNTIVISSSDAIFDESAISFYGRSIADIKEELLSRNNQGRLARLEYQLMKAQLDWVLENIPRGQANLEAQRAIANRAYQTAVKYGYSELKAIASNILRALENT